MSKIYDEMKKDYMKGWKTWNNSSVLSHVHMPDGLGIQLGVKEYPRARMLTHVLIGEKEEGRALMPRAHTYDGAYTELELSWGDNLLFVQTATEGDDLVILVTPKKQPPVKPSILLINGIVLWNREGTVERSEDVLWLKQHGTETPVYMTAAHTGELFANYTTPYLSADLSEMIGISTGKRRTVEEIQEILVREKENWRQNKEKWGELAECYNAMQTCQAWDTIYNPQNDVPITTVSRIWNNNWGGYVLFCWDTYFGALMQSMDEKELAYCNAIEITNTIASTGFVPNYICHNGVKSGDRSQPPVGSMVCLKIYERYQEKWFLEEVYENLLTWNRWFEKRRFTENGLLTWGSDPYEAKFGYELEVAGINEWQGAAWESGLDNSPMFDNIPFDTERHQFSMDDVGLTGLYINDCRCLAKIAEILGDDAAVQELNACAEEVEERMEELWDEEFGMYLNRRTDTGTFEYRLSPFHFHALFSHKVGQERAERMIKEHMMNPEEFWGEYVLPSIARNDPAYPDNHYWRGRIWAPMNFLVYMALQEYDLAEARKALAEKSEKLIMKEWLRDGHVHENYNADNGEGCDSELSDPFYHWGGLLAAIALMEREDRNLERYLAKEKYGRPVLAASGIEGAYDKCALDCPFVFWHNDRFYMLHAGFDGIGYQTALAVSDDLLHWEKECVIFPRGCSKGWDKGGIAGLWIIRSNELNELPTLKKINGKYWLIYHSYPDAGYEAGPAKIGIAWTEDESLHEWTCLDEPILSWEDGAAWEKAGLYKACVLEHEGRFYMYYNAKDSENWVWHEQIGMAVSDDLLHWKRVYDEPIVKNTPGGWDQNFCADPFVLWDGEQWVMYYYGYNGEHAQEGIAFSDDLYHWKKAPDPILNHGEKGELDEYHAHKPSVLIHDGVLYHFYCAVRPFVEGDLAVNEDPTKPGETDKMEHRCITVAVNKPGFFQKDK